MSKRVTSISALPADLKAKILSFVPAALYPPGDSLTALTEQRYRKTHEVKTDEGYDTRLSNGELHSSDDKPAVVHTNGIGAGLKVWFKDGVIHRDRNPAIICPTVGNAEIKLKIHVGKRLITLRTGSRIWVKNGVLLRQVCRNGDKIYYHSNGKVAKRVSADGVTRWYDANSRD